ncbi:MAG: STAS domain-containing protein [Candidatus Omnitrophica bacterium]|nr:STAS domain-containing protein [Candidatus Omnitrophota bacterium]MDD5487583.1 STAS domain-containing protein [Candidatus Omnitrophota bacterium]
MMSGKGRMENVGEKSGVRIMKVIGDFTAYTTPDFQHVCRKVDKSANLKGLAIDMKDLSRIDTSAFACMMNFIKENMADGLKIGIFNAGEKEKNMMELLGIGDAIRIYDSMEEAVEAMSG